MSSSAKKIRFGILGYSRVSEKNMIPALQSSGLAELFMIGSRMPEKAKKASEQYSCKSGDYEDVIKDKNIDAVYISLPNSMHEEWAVKAANAGKHVLCEKPAALSYSSAKKIIEAGKKNGVRIMEGFMFRYHPQHAKVMGLISEGVLGDCMHFNGIFSYPAPAGDNIRMKPELGGGAFYDAMPYPVYAGRMIFGEEPESVFCKLQIDGKIGVDIAGNIILSYPRGKSASASAMFGSYFQSKYCVLGSKGLIRAERAYAVPRDMATHIFLDANDLTQDFKIEPADHFRLMLDDFCGEIISGKIINKFEEDLLSQARVLWAAVLSGKENRSVRIAEIN